MFVDHRRDRQPVGEGGVDLGHQRVGDDDADRSFSLGRELGDGGVAERYDVAAAVGFVRDRGLPTPWLLGWSFGTELALKYGPDEAVRGAVLLSPPLHRTSERELARWHGDERRLVALIPELDDYLRPDAATVAFAAVPEAELIAVDGAKHLWVGETQVRRVLDAGVRGVAPAAYPLPTDVSDALVDR